MKILVVPNKVQLQSVEIEIRSSMTLAQWKIIHTALFNGAKANWSVPLSNFMDGISEAIEKIETNISLESTTIT